ncbi:MAG: hypothetical protein LBV53_02575 [Mycoplasmataceae bacterium]|jgi:hypothetical protein|nr:hypothetical protein [Mycoplasmataceae bacterium]
MNDNTISKAEELEIKLEAEKRIKLVEAKKVFENTKNVLTEKYNISLTKIRAKEADELAIIDNEFQAEVTDIDLKYN